jgi:wobble nucleotide-excising tRNase
MIKRINSIKNLGIFHDYRRDNNLQDFSERNLIYGWNYSGKTTLSRLFAFLEKKAMPDEFACAEFEIKLYGSRDPEPITQLNIDTCPLNVRVFNSDFINENLRYNTEDRKIQGIKFDVGENATIRETIEVNNKYIDESRASIELNKGNSQKFEEFERNIFTSVAGQIKNTYFKSAIEFNKGHFKKEMIPMNAGSLDNYIILDEAILKDTQNIAIAQSNKETIVIEGIESEFEKIFADVERILVYAPEQCAEDPVLSTNSTLYDWAKEGFGLHKERGLKQCAFCGNDVSGDRMAFLNSFFTNQAALLKDEIKKLKGAIENEKRLIRSVPAMTISPNDISEGLKGKWIDVQGRHKSIVEEYDKLLDILSTKLDEKYSTSLFVPIKIEDLDISANITKEQWIKDITDLVRQHNVSVEKFLTIREENRTKYKRHLVASVLKEKKYYELERKAGAEATKNAETLRQIKERERENIILLSQLKSITAGKTRLNDFIKLFLNRDDIQIDTTGDDYFVLKRGDKIARNLSEGEKTAVAFAYFIVMLESIEADGNLSSYLVFIDDPISSLDANHIAQVSAIINSFFFRKSTGKGKTEEIICKVGQLFVSTHNFEFYSFLKDATNFKRTNNSETAIIYVNGESIQKKQYQCLHYYMIRRHSADSSSIVLMPKYLTVYKSEYVYLFSEIFAFYETGCPEQQNILIPNAIRRFLEMYTLTRLPGNKGEVDNRVKELVGDVSELKILHTFSHFTSFERITKHNELLLRLPEIIEDIFTLLSHDTQHYNSLLEAIGKSTAEPEAIQRQEPEPVLP